MSIATFEQFENAIQSALDRVKQADDRAVVIVMAYLPLEDQDAVIARVHGNTLEIVGLLKIASKAVEQELGRSINEDPS